MCEAPFEIRSVRLKLGDRELARALFTTMAAIFDEPSEALSDDYIDRLLARDDFWAIASLCGDDIIAGVTAYGLPMTRTASSELFIYDIAVRREDQRKGVGRQLMSTLKDCATETGVSELFVAADNADAHALKFYQALDGTASPVTFFTFELKRQDA